MFLVCIILIFFIFYRFIELKFRHSNIFLFLLQERKKKKKKSSSIWSQYYFWHVVSHQRLADGDQWGKFKTVYLLTLVFGKQFHFGVENKEKHVIKYTLVVEIFKKVKTVFVIGNWNKFMKLTLNVFWNSYTVTNVIEKNETNINLLIWTQI